MPNGAYAELLAVPARIARVNLLPVPDGLASEVAAFVERSWTRKDPSALT